MAYHALARTDKIIVKQENLCALLPSLFTHWNCDPYLTGDSVIR